MNAGKEKYLPIAILSNVPVSQLQWQVEDKPDVEWVSNAISGVLVNQDPATVHCTNWVIGADGPCSIEWDTNSLSLTLDSGEAVDVIVDGWYSLSCSNGAISVTNSMAQLPGSNQTGTVSIVPARMLAPVP